MSEHKRLVMQNITKTYPGTIANDDIALTIDHGEIHALLGENGAGKSTLMKILYGVTKPDSGAIEWNGNAVEIHAPATARSLGIGMVFQHFSLFETLTIKENIALALGKEAGNLATLGSRIRDISNKYGMPLDPNRRVSTLSTGEKQRVEIVRCLLLDLQLLILDEPTSVLTPQEVERLFETLRHLRSEGCAILFISHKLHEVTALCDNATVLRQGKVTGQCTLKHETTTSLAKMMVGDETPIHNEAQRKAGGDTRLDVHQLVTNLIDPFEVNLKNLSFKVRAGEIVGIAGVAGNGQETLLKALSGELTTKGTGISFNETPINHMNAMQRRKLGMAFVPEDRLGRGAVPDMDLLANTLLTAYDQGMVKNGFILKRKIVDMALKIIDKYRVKTPGEHAKASSLSGGNLQKFIIGREVEQQPELLLMAHPTWGVDIGAQAAIHRTIFELRDAGCAILVVSEDLDELYKICDRLGAICDGKLSPFKATDELPLTTLGRWMTGDFTDTEDAA